MSTNRIIRLGILRIAVLLAVLASLVCLVAPREVINKADILGIGEGLGVGKAEAADLTPVTVDNSTSDMAVMVPSQRKLFYAAERFWIFYTDGSDLVYKSSSDGLSWTARSASQGALSSGDGMSIHFDGTYVHYARTTSTNNAPLYYRRGIPNADGTMTWSATEQVAVAQATGVRYLYPSISADSRGRALISYHYEKQNGHAGEGPYVTKSGNNDGTWGSTPTGFPYELTADSESAWYTTVHGLTADKVAVTFADDTNIKGVSVRTYDGANWNSIQTTVSNPQSGSGYSTVAQGDDIHIALLKTATNDILYCKYTYFTNTLDSEYTLFRSATSSSFPTLSSTLNNDLYCFWPGAPTASHVYYTRMISGVWDTDYTDWLIEANLTVSGGVSSFFDQNGSNYIGLTWETGSGSPYNVRFAAVSQGAPPSQPVNVSPTDMATGLGLTPTLQSSNFTDPDAGDTHGASQWQITATSGDYTSPVFDSQTDSLNVISILVPSGRLANSTSYYWHVRYQDNHGDWSNWSSETSFTTVSAANKPPSQPVNVSPTDMATGLGLTPTLQSSNFTDPDAGDTHGASQWQITAVSGDYTIPVFDSQTDTANLLSILVPSGRLAYSTSYYWHVRYRDNHGDWSNWSAETPFTTVSAANKPPNQPGNVTPADTASGLSLTPTLQSSDFLDPDAGDTHGASQWQITDASGDYSSPVFDTQMDTTNLLRIMVPSGKLGYSTTYYWHVRYQDNHGDWSNWSVETAFTTTTQPQANFSVSPVASSEGFIVVLFTNLSSGGVSPLTCAWDFDSDGTIDSTEWQPLHRHQVSETYTISLSIRDAAGDGDVEVKVNCLTVLSPGGAVVETADGQVRVEFPSGAVPDVAMVTIRMATTSGLPEAPKAFMIADTCFVILAQDGNGNEIVHLSQPSTMTARYSESDAAKANGHPENLVLAYWDEAAGRWKELETTVDTANMTLSASTTHLSTWAVLVKPTPASNWLLQWLLAVIAIMVALAAATATHRVFRSPAVAPEKPTSSM